MRGRLRSAPYPAKQVRFCCSFLLLCACGLAGCGSEGAAGFKGELRNSSLGYSVRFPEDWRGAKRPQENDVRALQGPGGRECLVVPVLGLPDWSSDRRRRSYYERVAKERELDVRSTEAVDGENARGVTTVTVSGTGDDRRLVRSTTFASGGVGVTLSCSAPEAEFDSADSEAFAPMASTVKLRRSPAAEKLQPRLAGLTGVDAAGVTITDERAQARLRLVSRDAGVPAVKEALRMLVAELDAPRISVQALKDPANPVIANWDARTGQAFLQAIPNPPERYQLMR